MSRRRWRSAVVALLWLASGVGLGLLWPYLNRPEPVPAADAVVAGVDPDRVALTLRSDAGRYLEIASLDREADTLLVIYPGGLVRPEAYSWIGVALAPHGVRTLIPEMPFDLAVTAPRRLDRLLAAQTSVEPRLVLAGHSLGGAMAARYALTGSRPLGGLALMGAFSATGDDLSETGLPVLALAAEHDGLATLDEVRDGMSRLPVDADLVVVGGAVHSSFGRYGPQRGDGVPTLPRDEVEGRIVDAYRAFLDRLDP